MILDLRITQAVILFSIIFISINSYEQAWAQNSTFVNELLDNSILSENSQIGVFLLFIIGIAIYSLFVWYFYRFISKRDLLPKFFYPMSKGQHVSKVKQVEYAAVYMGTFPSIIFAWFMVLAFFVFFISKQMPFEIAIFISMTIIGVVRILTYYREDAAKEVAKMIPYALLSFFLTTAVVFAEPNFFTEKEFGLIPIKIAEHFTEILEALAVITLFEFSFRIIFIIKRKILPVADKLLEDTIQAEVEEISKAHFKKMNEKEKNLEKRFEEMMKKLKDAEKTHS